MPGRLGPTLLACALLLVGFVAAIGRLTAGFEHWTFESLRRRDVANGLLQWPAMDLVDAAGRPLHLPAGGTGQVMLVDFIYTRCESICQALGAEFHQAQQQIRHEALDVHLLSISVDPQHDTPAALTAYGKRHRADARTWSLASPRTMEEGRRSRQQLGVIAIADGLGGYTHNGAVHVIDRHGRVAGIFDTADWQQALALAKRLAEARP